MTDRPPIDSEDNGFWTSLDELVSASTITIDRPKGTAHPRHPDLVYPLDYGYLENTQADDGNEIDVWRVSLPGDCVTAIVCAVDGLKRDAEVKLLIGCTPEEARVILATHNTGPQSAFLIERPTDTEGY